MRLTHRHNMAAMTGLVAYVAVLATAAIFITLDRMSSARIEEERKAAAQAEADGRRYIGTIIIPGEIAGQCRHLEFDNTTGAFREDATVQCDYESFAADSGPTRIDTIRDAFSKR